jgi:hypothetical protein
VSGQFFIGLLVGMALLWAIQRFVLAPKAAR